MRPQHLRTDQFIRRIRQTALLLAAGALSIALLGCEPQASQNGPVVNDAAAAANMPGGSGPGAPGAAAAPKEGAAKDDAHKEAASDAKKPK